MVLISVLVLKLSMKIFLVEKTDGRLGTVETSLAIRYYNITFIFKKPLRKVCVSVRRIRDSKSILYFYCKL